MIMIYTRFSADSRSSLTENLAQPSPLLAICTFAIRTSRSLRYLETPKLVLTHTNYGKAGFTQSEFKLHALSEVPRTPNMVLGHIKYGKAGCDREITSRLGGIDRDITTLSAHALIGHCLGNSHVICQNILFSQLRDVTHTQISGLFEGLILRSHPTGSKSKCNRVSQPPRRL